jgi:hypothetical protein
MKREKVERVMYMFKQLHDEDRQGELSCDVAEPWKVEVNVTPSIMDKRGLLIKRDECGFEDPSWLL